MQTGPTVIVLLGLIALATGQIFKIYNGTEVATHQFPFLAAVYARINGDEMVGCTASIISSEFILTAAHCLDQELLYVMIGNSEATQGIRYNIKQAVRHPAYTGFGSKEHDIALIWLASKIYADTGVGGIHLPIEIPDGKLMVTGYGFKPLGTHKQWGVFTPLEATDFKLDFPSKAQYATLDDTFVKTPFPCEGVNLQLQYCYHQINQGITQGDSGGPLVLYDDEDYHQIGISSCNKYLQGEGNDVDVVSVFTRIAPYCDWLTQASFGYIYCNDYEK